MHQERLLHEHEGNMPAEAAIEALLFVSSEGETINRLATALEWPVARVRSAVDALEQDLLDSQRGIVLQRHGDRLQLVSAPAFGQAVGRLLGLERTTRLSGASLETLALVAYRQPITRGEIEGVRGVDSGSVIATLLARELIAPVGRRSTPGNPTEYGSTSQFLAAFGLTSLAELPPLNELWLPAANAEGNAADVAELNSQAE
jgi:segregation and condensation protein B